MSDIFSRRQEQLDLMRDRWKHIPEVVTEIESFLVKADRKSREYKQLEKAYSVIQKVKDIPIEDDKRLPQEFGHFEQAKAWARQGILEIEAASVLRLNDMRAGAHTFSADARRWVSGLWWVHITPSFYLPAFLVVAHEEEQATGAFGIATSETTVSVSVTHSTLSNKQADDLHELLHHLDVFDLGGGLSLDGIYYELKIDTIAGDIQIQFGNPRTDTLIKLERMFIQVAEIISGVSSDNVYSNYLKETWRKYTSR